MNTQLLGALAIPGTELSAVSARVASAFGISTGSAADFVEKVLDAYGDAAAAAGGPYVKGTATGTKIAYSIQASTGVSLGRVVQTLNELAYLVSIGKVSLSTYNPAKYSATAKVKAAVKSAASTAKSAVKSAGNAIVPESLQTAGTGLAEGIAGLGDVAKMLPLLVVAGLGIYAYQTFSKGKRRA